MEKTSCCCCSCFRHLETLLLRLLLGLLFVVAGIGKFSNLEGFYQAIRQGFEKTFLPVPLLDLFSHALPFVETAVGVLLIAGFLTRPALVLAGLTLLSLFFGKILTHDTATCSQIALYLLITACALHRSESNDISIDRLVFGRKPEADAAK